jgi:dTDP-4-dehydrorhamnose 3,5-epimerase
MRFTETGVLGAVVIESDWHEDDRGRFARLLDVDLFTQHGLPAHYVQHSLSTNVRAGTLRGLHLQRKPHEEGKLVRCVRGSLFDVVADVRPGSASFGTWAGVELSAGDGKALFVPPGCAHGFQTMEDDTHVLYLIDRPYHPGAAAGVRWDDPTLGVRWPLPPGPISERDRALPLLSP